MILETWNQIRQSLHRLAPELTNSLQSGVSQSKLDLFESEITRSLPDHYKTLYLENNGQSYDSFAVFGAFHFLPLEEVIEERWAWKQVRESGRHQDSYPEVPRIKSQFLNPFWIPIALHFDDSCICIDLDPASDGEYGQIFYLSHLTGERDWIASDLNSWLTRYLHLLQTGCYEFDHQIGLRRKV